MKSKFLTRPLPVFPPQPKGRLGSALPPPSLKRLQQPSPCDRISPPSRPSHRWASVAPSKCSLLSPTANKS